MFNFPDNWRSFALRDPAGNLIRSGTASAPADFSGIAPGRYSLTSPDSAVRYDLILSSRIPGGVLSVRDDSGLGISVRHGGAGDGSPYLVSIQAMDGRVEQSFWSYGPEALLRVPQGEWRVVIAAPGDNGFSFVVDADDSGRLAALEQVSVVNMVDWFLPELTFGTKTANFTYNTGAVEFAFRDDVSPERIVQVRDLQTGTISTWFTSADDLSVRIDPGAFEWRVLGIAQQSIPYPDLFNVLNEVEGGWTHFVQREAGIRPPTGLRADADWLAYVIRTPAGDTVGAANGEAWLDFTGLVPGRYSVIGRTGQGEVRQEVVLSDRFPHGIALVSSAGDGSVRFRFGDDGRQDPYYVSVHTPAGVPVSAGYYYGQTITLALPDGDYRVSIAPPGGSGATVDLAVARGGLASVDSVATIDAPDWYLSALAHAAPLGPITGNSGTAEFSFVADGFDKFVIQIRDPLTGNVGTQLLDQAEFSFQVGQGRFEWRAFGIPAQAAADPDLVQRISSLQGGWTTFVQTDVPPVRDYVLGLEPDQVSHVDQLIMTYPSDAVRLDDGSVVITNTYASTILRVYPDGRVERLAGGFREGYIAEGDGPSVLLRGPAQMFDTGDGRILFSDQRNLAVRELDLGTGQVRTLFGGPGETAPRIENGRLVGVGDVYDIGRDAQGGLYITAAKTIIVGDQLFSDETVVLRQNADGRWRLWEFDQGSLVAGSFKFVDMLFHDGLVSVVAHNGGQKVYLKFDESGRLLGSLELGIGYGGGLIQDPNTGELLIGNHTAIVRLNHVTMTQRPFEFPETFANVSLMSRSGDTLVITDSDRGRVYEYDLRAGTIETQIGNVTRAANAIVDLEVVGDQLLMLDNQTPSILSFADNKVSIVAGGRQGAAQSGSSVTDMSMAFPNAITTGNNGEIFFVDANHRISVISGGIVSTFAGGLDAGYSGDGGDRLNARFQSVYGLDVAADGSLLVADSFNHAIRRIGADGTVSTIAGNGVKGLSDDADAAGGALNTPQRIIETAGGRILIADSWNNRVVELMPDGTLAPIAGAGNFSNYQGSGSFSGDGGDATLAGLNTPVGLAYYEPDGTLFIADSFNNRVRYVDSAGNIQTLVGGPRGFESGKLLNLPNDVALIGDDLYVADTGNALVLRLRGVDRTGNDLSGALDLGRAIDRFGFSTRWEHVDAQDADFYNLTSMAGRSLRLTAIDETIAIAFSNGTHDFFGGFSLAVGQSVLIDDDIAGFFAVTTNRTGLSAYRIDVIDGSAGLLESRADAGQTFATLAQAFAGDDRLPSGMLPLHDAGAPMPLATDHLF